MLQQRFTIDEEIKQIVKNLFELKNKNKRPRSAKWESLLFFKKEEDYSKLKRYLENLYLNEEYGLKTIARELEISYMQIRALFISFLDIEIKRGQKVVTERLKRFRKNRALYERKNNLGFASEASLYKGKTNKTTRGIQGFYWNKWFNKYIWLRSSWEFIFAKWLDSKNIKWDVEVKYFVFADGRKYLPDFFLFRENEDEYYQIVEIKGGFKEWDRGNHDKLKKEFINENIICIYEIENFIQEGSTKSKEIKLWKQIRKSKVN